MESKTLTLDKPIVINKVYDKLRLVRLTVDALDPKGEIRAMISVKPYASQTGELAPEEHAINILITDVVARMKSGDKEMAQIQQLVLEYVDKELKKTREDKK